MNDCILHASVEPNETKIERCIFNDPLSEMPHETWTASERRFISVLKGLGLESVSLSTRILDRTVPVTIDVALAGKIAASAIDSAACCDRAFNSHGDQCASADIGAIRRHTNAYRARLQRRPISIVADWHAGPTDPGVLAVRSISSGDQVSARYLPPIFSAEETEGGGVGRKGFVYLDLRDDPVLRLSRVCQCFDAYALWLRTMADRDVSGFALHMFSGHWRRVCFLHAVGNGAHGHQTTPLQARVALESKLRTLNRQEILGVAALLEQIEAAWAGGSSQSPRLFRLHLDEHSASIALLQPA